MNNELKLYCIAMHNIFRKITDRIIKDDKNEIKNRLFIIDDNFDISVDVNLFEHNGVDDILMITISYTYSVYDTVSEININKYHFIMRYEISKEPFYDKLKSNIHNTGYNFVNTQLAIYVRKMMCGKYPCVNDMIHSPDFDKYERSIYGEENHL